MELLGRGARRKQWYIYVALVGVRVEQTVVSNPIRMPTTRMLRVDVYPFKKTFQSKIEDIFYYSSTQHDIGWPRCLK